MISRGVIRSFCAFALVIASAQRGYGNQTISPSQAPTATLAPMNACSGTFDLIGDAFCDDGNNNKDCGKGTKLSSDSDVRTVTNKTDVTRLSVASD